PYDRLEEWLFSSKQRNEFFNLTKSRELEDYADVKRFTEFSTSTMQLPHSPALGSFVTTILSTSPTLSPPTA
ncbi:hypothetical protein BGZ91_003915, partial [Linnemannia elongata]